MAKQKKCAVCLGRPKTGSCMFCGKRFGKEGTDNRWLERVKWLTELKIQLRKYHQKSTGDTGLDLEIVNNMGQWRSDQILVRGVSGLIEIIQYPCSFGRRYTLGSDFESLSELEQKEIKECFIMKEPHANFKWAKA